MRNLNGTTPGYHRAMASERADRNGAAGDRNEARQRVIDERTTQILHATAHVISTRGAAETRLIDVAREADVSIGLIQHYFGSKLELMAAAFKFFNDRWIGEWESAANAVPDPIQKLALLLRLSAFEFEEWREVQWRIWIEFWSICLRDPQFDALYPEIYQRFHAPFRDAVTAGVESGCFTIRGTIDDVVDGLMAEIDGLRVRILLQPKGTGMSPMSRERMLQLLVRFASEELACEFPMAAAST
jgi:AcrR family transcriptional regulator